MRLPSRVAAAHDDQTESAKRPEQGSFPSGGWVSGTEEMVARFPDGPSKEVWGKATLAALSAKENCLGSHETWCNPYFAGGYHIVTNTRREKRLVTIPLWNHKRRNQTSPGSHAPIHAPPTKKAITASSCSPWE